VRFWVTKSLICYWFLNNIILFSQSAYCCRIFVLLSFIHYGHVFHLKSHNILLHFLLDFHKKKSLKSLWETGNRLALLDESEHGNFQVYWDEIDKTVCEIVEQSNIKLKEYKLLEIEKTKQKLWCEINTKGF